MAETAVLISRTEEYHHKAFVGRYCAHRPISGLHCLHFRASDVAGKAENQRKHEEIERKSLLRSDKTKSVTKPLLCHLYKKLGSELRFISVLEREAIKLVEMMMSVHRV